MPSDVDDRVEHEDVFVADELPHHAGGERAHHDLRHAERQRPHRRRPDRRARRAAEAEDARDLAPRVRVAREARRACGGRRHGLAAVGVPAHRSSVVPAELEDALAGDVRRNSGRPRAPTSTRVTAMPHERSKSRTKAASRPFVSSVAKRKTEGTSTLTIPNNHRRGSALTPVGAARYSPPKSSRRSARRRSLKW